MGNQLYQAILENVKGVPHVNVRGDYILTPEIKLDLPDVQVGPNGERITFDGCDIYCHTLGEIIVRFDTRTEKVRKFGILP